jgi:hypothetical protein
LLGVGQWQHGFFGVDGRKSKGFMVVLMTENVEVLMDKKKKRRFVMVSRDEKSE